MNNEKKVLTLKSKQPQTVTKSAAEAARDAFLKSTTSFNHIAKYGRYGY